MGGAGLNRLTGARLDTGHGIESRGVRHERSVGRKLALQLRGSNGRVRVRPSAYSGDRRARGMFAQAC